MQNNSSDNEEINQEKMFISKPMSQENYKNVRPISLNHQGTLDIQSMDEKMLKVFQNAGITE